LLTAALGGFTLGQAQGFGPEEALGFQDPRLRALQSIVEGRAGVLRAVELGFGAKVAVQSDLLPSLGLNKENTYLDIGWGRRPERLAQALRDYEQARKNLADAQVESTRQVLVTHARLLRAQERLRQLVARARQAELRLNSLQLRSDVPAADLERARNGVLGSQLELDNGQLELRQVQEAAARYGLQGAALPRVLFFALLEATVENFPAYRQAAGRLAFSEAETQVANLGFIDKIRLDAGLNGKDVDIRGGLEFSDGGFGVNTTLRQGSSSSNDPSLGLSLKLEIPINFAAFSSSAIANQSLELERQGLRSLREDLSRRYVFLRESIALAERGLDLSVAGAQAERARLKTAEADYQAGRLSEADWLVRQTDYRADEDLSRAWEEYINRVSDYLELVGAGWRAR
jgi:hypothetical protein